MDQNRYCRLMESDELELTAEELEAGWHFCWDWDGLLVSPEMPMEWKHCYCHPMKQADPGPQKQPSSVAQIEAQVKHINRELKDDP